MACPTRRSSTASSRGCSTRRSARCCPGTTTSGVSRCGCGTWRRSSDAASLEGSRDVRSVADLDVRGKRVFIRADLNVPLADGRIADPTRIDATLPTIRFVLDHGGRPVIASHLGRPKGKPRPELSLAPVGEYLGQVLDRRVALAPDCVGDATERLVRGADGPVLLENLRFHPEEEANDPGFARALARLADVYVNDAFGAAHRAHASTAGMAHFFRDKGAGLLLRREVEVLSRLLRKPESPFVAVLGGAKVSDKIGVLENLLGLVQTLCIGGA